MVDAALSPSRRSSAGQSIESGESAVCPEDLGRQLFGAMLPSVAFRQLPQDIQWINELRRVELQRIERAVEKRRIEFASGRAVAREALASLGLPAVSIPSHESRRPVWPDQIVGSISHTSGVAAAAVARQSELSAIGLDVERDEPLSPGVREMILTSEELRWFESSALTYPADKLIFSCKEAIYKCVNPIVDEYFGFQDVHVRFFSKNSFEARLTGRRNINFPWSTLQGRFAHVEGRVWSAAWVEVAD